MREKNRKIYKENKNKWKELSNFQCLQKIKKKMKRKRKKINVSINKKKKKKKMSH